MWMHVPFISQLWLAVGLSAVVVALAVWTICRLFPTDRARYTGEAEVPASERESRETLRRRHQRRHWHGRR